MGFVWFLCSISIDDDYGGVSVVFVGVFGDMGVRWCLDNIVVEVYYVIGEFFFVDIDDCKMIDGVLVY